MHLTQEKKAATDEFDMFSADKVDDMFGDAPVGAPMPLQNAPKRGLLDNYDDSEGYYNFQVSACPFTQRNLPDQVCVIGPQLSKRYEAHLLA